MAAEADPLATRGGGRPAGPSEPGFPAQLTQAWATVADAMGAGQEQDDLWEPPLDETSLPTAKTPEQVNENYQRWRAAQPAEHRVKHHAVMLAVTDRVAAVELERARRAGDQTRQRQAEQMRHRVRVRVACLRLWVRHGPSRTATMPRTCARESRSPASVARSGDSGGQDPPPESEDDDSDVVGPGRGSRGLRHIAPVLGVYLAERERRCSA
jgi:hypothetical protein